MTLWPRRLETPRLRIGYLERAGTGPTVVFIHPNRTTNRVWDFVIGQSRLSKRFLAPALRGHNDSDWPETGYTLEHHRDDLIGFIEATNDAAVVLVGQATGATLALMIGAARPDLVRAIVAAQPALGIPASVNDLVQGQVAAQQRLASREAARAALPFAERWSQAVTEHFLDHMLDTHPDGGLVWRYHAPGVCQTEAELMRDLSTQTRWRGPALVFGGAESTVLPSSMFARAADAIPGAQRASLPGANHRLCQDNPEGFARLLDDFVQQLG